MTPPFPWSLSPRTARRQATGALVLFYGLVYGTVGLIPHGPQGVAASLLSILLLGALMLLAVTACVRRDVSWRGSLALGRQRVGSVVGWSLFGFAATYAVNVCLTAGYLLSRGGLEAQAAARMPWLHHLAEIPAGAILPLTVFVGFWEETVFRGFLLGRLRAALPAPATPRARLLRDTVAVALCAVCFGAGHGYQGALGLMQTTTAGIVLGAVTVWRGSLWPAIGAHLTIDAFGLLVIKAVSRTLSGGMGGGFGL
jgi:membrane protease YdiL (CAAX protease family)